MPNKPFTKQFLLSKDFRDLPVDLFVDAVEFHSMKFAEVYRQLALYGEADELGSEESKRVFQTWVEAGQPEGLVAFIILWANIRP